VGGFWWGGFSSPTVNFFIKLLVFVVSWTIVVMEEWAIDARLK
jgi:hypothetical protein